MNKGIEGVAPAIKPRGFEMGMGTVAAAAGIPRK
jgi:hypothetical protein